MPPPSQREARRTDSHTSDIGHWFGMTGAPFRPAVRAGLPPPPAGGGIPSRPQARSPCAAGALCVPCPRRRRKPGRSRRRNAPCSTTARRPGRAARPISRRARLGAPPAGTGNRATGTPTGRQGPPTPAGRPTASQGRPRRPPCAGGGCRAPGFRAAREPGGADPTRRRPHTHQAPQHHTPPRGPRRDGARRPIRIKGAAVCASLL